MPEKSAAKRRRTLSGRADGKRRSEAITDVDDDTETNLHSQLKSATHEMEIVPPRWLMRELSRGTDPNTFHYDALGRAHRHTTRGELARRGYLLCGKLGEGSYATVRLALVVDRNNWTASGKVAVKIVDLARVSDSYEDMAPREAQLWARVRHPHVARFVRHFTDGQRVYLVLEHVTGGEALTRLSQSGSLTEAKARIWMYQVCDAVSYLHDSGIAHRDLKLENMLLDENGNIKICDFGFARHMTSADERSRTYCGSRPYAAPEIIEGRPYDPFKADVWAIGVILFVIVTGRTPFQNNRSVALLLRAQRDLSALYWSDTTRTPARSVSKSCQVLGEHLLTFDFIQRPSVRDALKHPWFRSTHTKRPRATARNITTVDRVPTTAQRKRKRSSSPRKAERSRYSVVTSCSAASDDVYDVGDTPQQSAMGTHSSAMFSGGKVHKAAIGRARERPRNARPKGGRPSR